jgi:hypothetical protein
LERSVGAGPGNWPGFFMDKTGDEIFDAFWIILKKRLGDNVYHCRCCVKIAFEIAIKPYLK